MTPSERARAFSRARDRIWRAQVGLMRGTRDELARLLREAQRAIAETLAAQPTDYERWSLPQLSAEVRRAAAEFGERGAARISSDAGRAWEQGERLVEEPLEAGGARIAALLPRLDTRQLQAMRAFMVDRIKDVGQEAANKIIAELGLAAIGARAPSEAIGAVRQILGGASRARATTIVRTELGRAFSAAAQARMESAQAVVPALKKQWRRSGKLHPRLHHDLADGQVAEVGKPFVLKAPGGEVRLMFPRDPAAPAAETINCGCVALPYMERWAKDGLLQAPGRAPGGALGEERETIAEVLARAGAARLAAPRVRRVLRDAERRLAKETVERVVVISGTGETVFEAAGGVDSVTVPADKVGLLRGAIVAHNHPDVVASFSLDDVALAAEHGVAELRLVDERFSYSLRPGAQGWSGAFRRETVAAIVARVSDRIVAEWTPLVAQGKITQSQFDGSFMDEIWQRVSKESGLRYRRKMRRR